MKQVVENAELVLKLKELISTEVNGRVRIGFLQ